MAGSVGQTNVAPHFGAAGRDARGVAPAARDQLLGHFVIARLGLRKQMHQRRRGDVRQVAGDGQKLSCVSASSIIGVAPRLR